MFQIQPMTYPSIFLLVLITSWFEGAQFRYSTQQCYAEDVPVIGYEQRLDQARLYINNQMFLAALNELKQLKTTTKGKSDGRVSLALANVYYRLHNITAALGSLREARSQAQNDKDKARLTELYDQWINMYGLVRLESENSLIEGSLTLARDRKIINRDRREMFAHVTEELAKGVQLPISVYLPYGNYTVNGVPFRLERDKPTPVVNVILTPIENASSSEGKQSDIPWTYIGVGGAAVIVLTIGGYLLMNDTSPPVEDRPINIILNAN